MRWYCDVFKVKKSSFFHTDFTDPLSEFLCASFGKYQFKLLKLSFFSGFLYQDLFLVNHIIYKKRYLFLADWRWVSAAPQFSAQRACEGVNRSGVWGLNKIRLHVKIWYLYVIDTSIFRLSKRLKLKISSRKQRLVLGGLKSAGLSVSWSNCLITWNGLYRCPIIHKQ